MHSGMSPRIYLVTAIKEHILVYVASKLSFTPLKRMGMELQLDVGTT
jgi:hypothetical protein